MLIKFLEMKSIFTLVNIHIFEEKFFFFFFNVLVLLWRELKWICLFIPRGQS